MEYAGRTLQTMLSSYVMSPERRAGKAEVHWALAQTPSSATLTSRASLQKGLACSSRSTLVSASAGYFSRQHPV